MSLQAYPLPISDVFYDRPLAAPGGAYKGMSVGASTGPQGG